MIALALLAAALATAGDAPPLPAPAEEQRVRTALADGRADAAIAALAGAVAAREAQAALEPEAAARAIDALATAVFEGAEGSDAATAAAESAFHRALALRTRLFGPRSAETANSMSTLSTFAFVRGRWDESESWERQGLAIRREALPQGDPRIADNLNELGVVLVTQGRLTEAQPLIEESVRIFDASPQAPPGKRLEARNSLGELYRLQDRPAESERTFREAIAAAEVLGPEASMLTAALVNNLAGLLKDGGDLAEAETLTRRSLTLRESAPDPDPADVSVAYLNLAEIYRLEGNAAEAEPLYLQSIDLAAKGLGPDNPDLATHYGQLSVLYRETKRTDDARAWSDRALVLLERTLGAEHPLLAQALHDRGVLETGAGRTDAALSKLRRALTIRERAYGGLHPEVASTLTELSRAEIAAGPKEAARAPANLGRAIRILETTPSFPETAIDARVLRAELARRKGDAAAARSDLTSAAELIESLRPHAGGGEATRAAFMARHAVVYEELVDLALTRGQIASAFEWMERSRGRALLDQLVAGGVDVLSGVAEPRRSELGRRQAAARTSLAEWQARADVLLFRDDLAPALLAARAAEARKELAAAAAELRRVDEETKNESALWRSASGGRPVTLDTARGSLFPREVMLAYQIGERASWLIQIPRSYGEPTAWRLSASAPEASVLGIAPGPLARASLEKVLDGPAGVLAELARRPVPGFPDENPKALAALFDVLMPKAARATTAATWAEGYTIIPDGLLARLPFEALVVKFDADGAPRYWLDDHAPIRYAVSATLLSTLSGLPPTASSGLLSVADPDYRSSRWPRLPGTARESDAVAAAIGKGGHDIPVTLLRRAAATKTAVRDALAGKRFIHLAVHAVVDEGRGDLLAGLVLAGDELLQLFEIYELDLDADIAVLSACSTGRGTQIAGEGVFALGRGFLAGGTRRVVASQWEVDDFSTATLVAAFFEALPYGGVDEEVSPNYAGELARAKRRVRDNPETAAPFFWAPFVLSGLR